MRIRSSIAHHSFPFATLHYAMIFAMGSLLAKHRQELDRQFRSLGFTRILVAAIALLLVAYGTTLGAFTPQILRENFSDLIITAGNSAILIAALSDGPFKKTLLLSPIRTLGRISYSFYLLHLPVLFLAVCLLWTRIGHIPLFIIALIATILLGMLSYRWVELPCVALGKYLTRDMKRSTVSIDVNASPTRKVSLLRL